MPVARIAALSLVVSALSFMGCGGGPQGPRIRFAQASSAQIQSAQNEDVVWYEFRAGDRVPMIFVLQGIVKAEAETPVFLEATRDFWVVVYKDGRQFFSFDGAHLYRGELGKFGLFLAATEEGPASAVMLFIGQRADMPAELR